MSYEPRDEDLAALKGLRTPAVSPEAQERAVQAALLAYDAEQQKRSRRTQGAAWRTRLTSVVPKNLGNWIMDTRLTFGLGTAAVALLLLPLGYQLYSSTVITPLPERPRAQPEAVVEPPVAADSATEAEVMELAEPSPPPPQAAAAKTRQMAQGSQTNTGSRLAAPLPAAQIPNRLTAGAAASGEGASAPMPSSRLEPSGDSFAGFDPSPLRLVAEAPVSTFSIDVDTASYAYVRRLLRDGILPEPAAVRVEELLNYFRYDYPAPETDAVPFRPSLAVFPTPWNADTQLLRIGLKGYVPPATEDRPSNLVFLIDTSGSMDAPDRLPLLKRAFALLVEQLSENDTVSIVAYAGSAGVVLEPTAATDQAGILAALDRLWAGGSTAGAEGIELAYRLAEQNRVEGGVNRVILATDGDFNVGIADPEELVAFIKQKRDAGVFLSVLGFGQGNLDDATMQALAQNGNGNASYIDSFREAQKVLVEEVGGTLVTIAKDVKVQVEFNPAVVSEYRLIGYETRALAREDFNNDRVDAGEIGAGHEVTALYEITPAGSGGRRIDPLRYGGSEAAPALPRDEFGFLKLRYKLPEARTSTLLEMPIGTELAVSRFEAAPEDARFAAMVAAFGQKLAGSDHVDITWDEIREGARAARGEDPSGHRAEFVQLVGAAAALAPDR